MSLAIVYILSLCCWTTNQPPEESTLTVASVATRNGTKSHLKWSSSSSLSSDLFSVLTWLEEPSSSSPLNTFASHAWHNLHCDQWINIVQSWLLSLPVFFVRPASRTSVFLHLQVYIKWRTAAACHIVQGVQSLRGRTLNTLRVDGTSHVMNYDKW